MESPRVVISLVGAAPPVRTWASSTQLRIGRMSELEVALDDMSVSRIHAEILIADEGWVVRDRGSSNGTILNGVRIGRTPQQIKKGDSIQIGVLVFKVEHLEVRPVVVKLGNKTVAVESSTRRSWAEAVDNFDPTNDAAPRDTTSFLRLLRGGYKLAEKHTSSHVLQEVVNDTLTFFNARRVAVFLHNDITGQLTIQSLATKSGAVSSPRPPGKTLATLAFRGRQSLLFRDRQDAAIHQADSAVRGEMNSIICAILRSPDREIGVLHIDRGPDQECYTHADLYFADSLAAALALGLDRQQLVERHQALFIQTVTALAQAVEMRDEYTGNHTQRVTTYSLMLAEEMGLSEEQRKQLQVATVLHDIGKIAIDDQILRKPGRLSDYEFDRMKTHVIRGAEIIQMIPGLSWAMSVVRGHHERWDGRGYPDGLKGEAIPLPARVVAVADAFDAMTSDRPYRVGMPVARAFAELQSGAGTHFDPACVEAFVRIRPKLEAMIEREAAELREAESGVHTISRQELERERGVANHTGDPVRSAFINTLIDKKA